MSELKYKSSSIIYLLQNREVKIKSTIPKNEIHEMDIKWRYIITNCLSILNKFSTPISNITCCTPATSHIKTWMELPL